MEVYRASPVALVPVLLFHGGTETGNIVWCTDNEEYARTFGEVSVIDISHPKAILRSPDGGYDENGGVDVDEATNAGEWLCDPAYCKVISGPLVGDPGFGWRLDHG